MTDVTDGKWIHVQNLEFSGVKVKEVLVKSCKCERGGKISEHVDNLYAYINDLLVTTIYEYLPVTGHRVLPMNIMKSQRVDSEVGNRPDHE